MYIVFEYFISGGFKAQPQVDRQFSPVLGSCHYLEQ